MVKAGSLTQRVVLVGPLSLGEEDGFVSDCSSACASLGIVSPFDASLGPDGVQFLFAFGSFWVRNGEWLALYPHIGGLRAEAVDAGRVLLEFS